MNTFSIIVAYDAKRGIGRDNLLPWHLSPDMRRFKHLTTTTRDPHKQNAIIMGRKTWESIPAGRRPLAGRLNIVVTSRPEVLGDSLGAMVPSLDQALALAWSNPAIEKVFVIGGSQLFGEAVPHPACRTVYATELKNDFDAHVHFPALPPDFKQIDASPWQADNGQLFRFVTYART